MLTEQQLRSYLAWAIHGRKPPRRATSSTRRRPPRDEAHLAWIREMPCIGCGIEGRNEAAHTGGRGGDENTLSDSSRPLRFIIRKSQGYHPLVSDFDPEPRHKIRRVVIVTAIWNSAEGTNADASSEAGLAESNCKSREEPRIVLERLRRLLLDLPGYPDGQG